MISYCVAIWLSLANILCSETIYDTLLTKLYYFYVLNCIIKILQLREAGQPSLLNLTYVSPFLIRYTTPTITACSMVLPQQQMDTSFTIFQIKPPNL